MQDNLTYSMGPIEGPEVKREGSQSPRPAPTPKCKDTPCPTAGDLCVCTPTAIGDVSTFPGCKMPLNLRDDGEAKTLADEEFIEG